MRENQARGKVDRRIRLRARSQTNPTSRIKRIRRRKSRALKKVLQRKRNSRQRKNSIQKSSERLKPQVLQIISEWLTQLFVLQRQLDGSDQEAQFVSSVIGNSLIDVCPQTLFPRKDLHRVGKLYFAAGARFGSFQAIENCRGKNVASSDGKI